MGRAGWRGCGRQRWAAVNGKSGCRRPELLDSENTSRNADQTQESLKNTDSPLWR